MLDNFDLIEYQEKARNITDPEQLFKFWDKICLMREKKYIRDYELQELKEVIFDQLALLNNAKKQLNQ